MKPVFSRLIKIFLSTLGCLCATGEISLAQVTSDDTVNTQVEQDGGVAEITGGETRGSNLFHSFEDFSVPTNNEAFFDNAESIGSIFSRVTGGDVSNIEGAIRANGGADLFLINPAGIVFGENASLNIGGSFYGSTADSIIFPDGEFSATAPESESVLTVDVPIGLGFGSSPGNITNNSIANDERGLEVAEGNNITLLGGNINFNRGTVTASGGIVNLGGLSTAGEIIFDEDNSLSFPENIARADISFSNAAGATVAGTRGGDINVFARNLKLVGGDSGASGLEVAITADSTLTDAQAGDVTIDATNNTTVDDSLITNVVDVNTIRDAGDINITTDSLSITNSGLVITSTRGQGDAGSVNITAEDTISLDSQNSNGSRFASGVVSEVAQQASGDSGGINITTGSLSLSNGGQVGASTEGQGNAGSVNITAENTISIDGRDREFPSGIFGIVDLEGVGNAGDINITTDSLSLANGGLIDSSTRGKGNAGSLKIVSLDEISISGESSGTSLSLLTSRVAPEATGDAGVISMTTDSLSLTNGGQVNASTFGQGNAGSVEIIANDNISIDGESSNGFPSGIDSTVELGAVGDAKDISMTTGSLSLTNGGQVAASTFGQGNAGSVEIVADGLVSIDGESSNGNNSSANSSVANEASGDSGNVSITTGSLSLSNGGQVSTSTLGEGNAGLLEIAANDNISIDGESSDGFSSIIASIVQAGAVGNAGDTSITTDSLSLTNGGEVSTSTFGQGNAGSIEIMADGLVSIDGGGSDGDASSASSSVARQASGNGGNVSITTGSLLLSNGGEVGANTLGEGNAGSVEIIANDDISIDGEGSNSSPSVIGSAVDADAVGDAGEINITTDSLSLTKGGQVSASTFGRGNAGSVEIVANDDVSVDGERSDSSPSSVNNGVAPEAIGNAGGVDITTNSLNLTNGGEVTTSSFGEGKAGSVEIIADDSISLDGMNSRGNTPSNITSLINPGAIGDAGGVEITTDDLSLADGALVSVSNRGEGNAGRLNVNSNSLNLSNDAEINALTTSGQGGNIELQIAEDLTLENNSTIDAQAFEGANGGNLSIDAKFIVASPNQDNDLVASAEQGTGGNIDIVSSGVFGLEERSSTPDNNTNDIDASSKLGVDGTVNLNTNYDFLNSFELIEPEFAVAKKALAGSCFARRNSRQGSFVYGGTGGLPVSPDSTIDEEESYSSRLSRVKPNLPSPNPLEVNSTPTPQKWQIGDPIVEPTHLIKTADGRLLWINKQASRDSLACK